MAFQQELLPLAGAAVARRGLSAPWVAPWVMLGPVPCPSGSPALPFAPLLHPQHFPSPCPPWDFLTHHYPDFCYFFPNPRRSHTGADEDPSLLSARPRRRGDQEEAIRAGSHQVEQKELVLEVGIHPPLRKSCSKGLIPRRPGTNMTL